MFTQSTPRQRLAAWIAPTLGLLIAGQCSLASANDSGCCPPSSCNPCQPGEWLSTEPLPSTIVPSESYSVPTDSGVPSPVPMTDDTTGVAPAPLTDVFGGANDFNAPPASNVNLSSGLASNFGRGGATALAFADTINTPGYIDSAVIRNRVRVRYDNATGANNPARAGFLYPTLATGQDYDGGRGPVGGVGVGVGNNVDIEQISTYVELAFRDRFSIFVDVPVRFLGPIDFDAGQPFDDGTQAGAGDISAGFRWGWIAKSDEHLTFQLRTTTPTGEARRALGTGNTTMDFSLLYDRRFCDVATFFAEFNDWQTLDAVTLNDTGGVGSTSTALLDQDANIMRFGVGLGVDFWSNQDRSQPITVTGITELVTWTVLQGVNSPLDGSQLEDAAGDTIVNGKYGLRISGRENSLYVGYGHNWTSDRWYSDLFRLEWQHNF
ncbi:hypothetical protein [Neorhodopirellula pilleata]|uniref:Secreted protein n=1 Tax=Neorhodopirellula pilleata TaxID=2714738 RepID=A0A5C5ZQG8_9BACT|nr:hypothetical protein [Neorhodopirellula pilleata]TWT89500.1 hypothetical protein Pla100_54290 [Neorhodopirellula pilleata]